MNEVKEKAFFNFEKIEELDSVVKRHREWLKDYSGNFYSIADEGKHKIKWKSEPQYYKDSIFKTDINMISRKKNRLVIEFDDKKDNGGKDEEKIQKNLDKIIKKLKYNEWGYIRSTHNGASDYIWIEFDRKLTTEEAKKFLYWIAPSKSEIDLNFASDKKVYPVLFAGHWKYPRERETPIEFYEGNKIDYDKIKDLKEAKINEQVDSKGYSTAIKYDEKEINYSIEKFKDPKLLNFILKELSKTHFSDSELKLTTFLTAVSGLAKNPNKRMSIAIKGNSSEGKDNNIRTSLLHIPRNAFIFLTSGTQATIEDDIKDTPIIAFSEVNANRETGANKHLTEVIKQKTEGGTSSIKKDIRAGRKGELRKEVGEQASVLYATTEAETDEELQTRFIEGFIDSDYHKIKSVNDMTLDNFSDIDKMLKGSLEKDSWIRIGLTQFYNKEEQYEIYIPYAKYLKEKIEGDDIFDHNSPRSMRDIKRVLNLTCAMTYLFQEQREIIEHNNHKILVSEPQDFINTLIISSIFFNQSYTGLDNRIKKLLKIMKEIGGDWVARDEIQNKMSVSRNTIKSWCDILAGEGYIRGQKGVNLNESTDYKIYDGNKIYYERYQKGVKKPLIRCQLSKLQAFLEQKTGKPIDTFDFSLVIDDKTQKNNEKRYQNKGVNLEKDIEKNKKNSKNSPKNGVFSENNAEIDTFELTPSQKMNKLLEKNND